MKKSLLIFVLVMMLVVGLVALVGCSQPDAENEVSDEIVTVDFSYPPYGYDTAKETAFWEKYIAQFEAENPNIKINMVIESWDNVLTKWEQAAISGDTPDIGYNSPMSTINMSMRDYLAPVTDIIEDLGGEDVFTAPSFYFKNDGEWWGVPNCDSSIILAYRKDLLSAAGYDAPPTTWDELLEIAQATTKDGVYGLGIYTSDSHLTNQLIGCFMEAAGGEMLNEAGEVNINTPENLEALNFMVSLVNEYKVVPLSSNDWKYGDDANALGVGKVAMDFMWGGYGTLIESMYPDDYENIGFTELPAGPSGHSGSSSGTGGFILFKDAKHPEEAKQFIEFMSREEISMEWCLASGNVSPFFSVTEDPDLTQYEWYQAMADQAPYAVTPGWNFGIAPGMDIVDDTNVFAKNFASVLNGTKTAEQALLDMHNEVASIMETAQAQIN